DDRAREREETLGRDVLRRDRHRARRIAIVAHERASIRRIVVAREKIAHEGLPLAGLEERDPARDALGAVERREAAQLLLEERRVGEEMGVILEEERDTEGLRDFEAEAA